MSRRRRAWWGVVPAVVAFGSFALGTYGFWEMLPPPRSLFETLPDAAWWALQMFFMNFEDPREAGGPVGPALQAARFGAFVTTVRVILQAFFPQAWQTARRWCRPS
ncbi:hypothetical protein [Tistrella mobilis]